MLGVRRAGRDGRGLVTVELSLAIVAGLLVALMLCSGIGLMVLQLRLVDTASAVARQEARGDRAAARSVEAKAPRGSTVRVSRSGEQVRVTVTLVARPLDVLPALPMRAEATVLAEPGAVDR